jgi:hypothetical protein
VVNALRRVLDYGPCGRFHNTCVTTVATAIGGLILAGVACLHIHQTCAALRLLQCSNEISSCLLSARWYPRLILPRYWVGRKLCVSKSDIAHVTSAVIDSETKVAFETGMLTTN